MKNIFEEVGKYVACAAIVGGSILGASNIGTHKPYMLVRFIDTNRNSLFDTIIIERHDVVTNRKTNKMVDKILDELYKSEIKPEKSKEEIEKTYQYSRPKIVFENQS